MPQKVNASLIWNLNTKIFGGPLQMKYTRTTSDLPEDCNMPNYCLENSNLVTKFNDVKGNGEHFLYGVTNVYKTTLEALGFLWSSKLSFKIPTAD